MRIKSIKQVGKQPVYDLSVKDAQHYVLENGVVTHNTGGTYNSHNVIFITKAKVKNTSTNELEGHIFTLVVDKSRTIREGTKIPLEVTYTGGIQKYTGMLEIGLKLGWITKASKKGKYQFVDKTSGEIFEEEYSKKDLLSNDDFWKMAFDKGMAVEAKNFYSLDNDKISIVDDEEMEVLE